MILAHGALQGLELVYADVATDYLLLRISSSIPASFKAYMLVRYCAPACPLPCT